MSNLSNILNPEGSRNKLTSAPNSEAPSENGEGNKEKDIPSTRQRNSYTIYEHEPHPDCPDTLACLPDTDGRPQHTLPVILRCSILGSPRKRLTIREIYSAMEEKYPFYKTAGPTWKQSVRHHLSLNRLFERQPRPVTDPGFGSYWTVNLTAPPGTKRPRKRGRANKDSRAGDEQSTPKSPTDETTPIPSTSTSSPSESVLRPVKKRGRPRKASASTVNRDATPMSSSYDEGDHNMDLLNGPPESDEEWQNRDEEGIPSPFGRRESAASLPPFNHGRPPVASYSLPPLNTSDSEPPEVTIARLRDEVGNLRRQSAEAVSVSLRLSEQLAQANCKESDLQETIQELREELEDEQARRKEAERLANEEAIRGRQVNDAIVTGSTTVHSPDRNRQVERTT